MGKNILMVTSEYAPFAKTGGLGDALFGLSDALARLGHQVSVLLPLYKSVKDIGLPLKKLDASIELEMAGKKIKAGIELLDQQDNPRIIFLRNDELYDRSGLYQDENTRKDYEDNDLRFGFFARSASAVCKALKFKPDIIHAHDWQGGLAVASLYFSEDAYWKRTASVFTIHNLAYQGLFPEDRLSLFGLPGNSFTEEGVHFFDQLSLLKAGIAYADSITTVSVTYAEEIQTEELGCGLHELIRSRSEQLTGIINGVDYRYWSPEKDHYIKTNYSLENLPGKENCKQDLLNEFGISNILPNSPVFGVVSRIVEQKGLDIIIQIAPDIIAHNGYLIILGQGDVKLEGNLKKLQGEFPEKICVRIGYNERLAHKIEAGADFFLMPSRFEPCGLNQMYSLRYGTIPIVHAVGGLDDTVKEYSFKTGYGTGFKFFKPEPEALLKAIAKALDTYLTPEWLIQIRRNAMNVDYSWNLQAKKYVRVYNQAIKNMRNREQPTLF